MKKEETVKLISAEGFEFIVDKQAAMVSQTIRNMLTSPGFSIDYSRISGLQLGFENFCEFYGDFLVLQGDLLKHSMER